MKELVADAISGGAKAVTGGHPMDRPGYFFEPTILAGLTDGTRIVDKEQFGPALPVISYRDVNDAVERANATHFGLSGSVWDPTSTGPPRWPANWSPGPPGWTPISPWVRPNPSGASSGAASGSRTGPGAWPSSPNSRWWVAPATADGLNISTAGLVSWTPSVRFRSPLGAGLRAEIIR